MKSMKVELRIKKWAGMIAVSAFCILPSSFSFAAGTNEQRNLKVTGTLDLSTITNKPQVDSDLSALTINGKETPTNKIFDGLANEFQHLQFSAFDGYDIATFSLPDPNADRIYMWNEALGTAGRPDWLTIGTGLQLTGVWPDKTLSVDIDLSGYLTSSAISDTAYDATSWNSDTTHAPSKNAVRDKIETLQPLLTLGTGVQPALGVAIGSAGAPILFNGAGGTPSSMTGTNITGIQVSGITASTSTALGVGSIELGHATDTTIARSGAGAITVEGNAVLLSGGALGTPSSGTGTNLTGIPESGVTNLATDLAAKAPLASPTLVTPNIGVATGTSLTLGTGALTAGATTTRDLTAAGGTFAVSLGTGHIVMYDGALFGWSSSASITPSSTQDLILARDAANTLALRNSTNAQNFRIYNTFTTVSTAGEWLSINWTDTSNTLSIGTKKGSSSGTLRPLRINFGDGTAAIDVPAAAGFVKVPKLNISSIPTSSSGLSSGDVYSNAGILTIVP